MPLFKHSPFPGAPSSGKLMTALDTPSSPHPDGSDRAEAKSPADPADPSSSSTPAPTPGASPLPPASSTEIAPPSSFAIADALDATTSIPDFLNSLLPYPPPPLPSTNLPPAINGGGLPAPDLATIDKSLNELLTRLSLLSQDTSSALEQSMHEISRTVPRLTYDLQFMRESASSLQTSLSLVQGRVARQSEERDGTGTGTGNGDGDGDGDGGSGTAGGSKTYRSLEKLTHLDKLKVRMESARDVLREAESWSTLEGEITSFIGESAWDKAGSRLAEASKSLVVFQATPGEYEARRGLLVSLQNELETALASALATAIGGSDTEGIARFARIFAMMDRADEFRNYYFSARRAPIIDEWSTFTFDDDKFGSGSGFTASLTRFYSTLLSTLTSEKMHIPRIFSPEPAPDILANFLHSTLDALSPSIQNRLSTMADSLGALALPELIRAYRATEELGVAISALMERLALPTPTTAGLDVPLASPGITTPNPRPTPNKRMSSAHFPRPGALLPSSASVGVVNGNGSQTVSSQGSGPSLSEWETALYEPFLDLQASYASLERQYLLHQLRTDVSFLSAKRDVAGLYEKSLAAFTLASEAISRSQSFTHGYGSAGLVDAVSEFLVSFLDGQAAAMSSGNVVEPEKEAQVADELDFGLDYSTEDWAAFQTGLHVLKTCRDIESRLRGFEERLYVSLESALSTPAPASSGTSTTPGAILLLQQSPLNSSELHALLSSLSPPAQPLGKARASLGALTRQSQAALQTTILTPLQSLLVGYPSLSVWNQPEKAARRDGLSIPTFSLSPTDTIARVSEGLLNLLRVFEVHANDDALAFSIETLPFVDGDMLAELARSLPEGELEPSQPNPASGAGSESGSGPALGSGGVPPLNAETVLSTWVSSLALSLLSHLTSRTLPSIKHLSSPGAAQLSADLGYLSNAVRALDVEWDELERWREAAECKDEGEWRGK